MPHCTTEVEVALMRFVCLAVASSTYCTKPGHGQSEYDDLRTWVLTLGGIWASEEVKGTIEVLHVIILQHIASYA